MALTLTDRQAKTVAAAGSNAALPARPLRKERRDVSGPFRTSFDGANPTLVVKSSRNSSGSDPILCTCTKLDLTPTVCMGGVSRWWR